MISELANKILEGDKKAIRSMQIEKIRITDEQTEELLKLSKNKGIKIIEVILINRIPQSFKYYSKEEKENLMIDMISELSEDIYASGWNDKIEFELWNWCKAEIPQEIEHRVINEDLAELKNLSEKLKLWAIWNTGNDPIAIKLDKWITLNE